MAPVRQRQKPRSYLSASSCCTNDSRCSLVMAARSRATVTSWAATVASSSARFGSSGGYDVDLAVGVMPGQRMGSYGGGPERQATHPDRDKIQCHGGTSATLCLTEKGNQAHLVCLSDYPSHPPVLIWATDSVRGPGARSYTVRGPHFRCLHAKQHRAAVPFFISKMMHAAAAPNWGHPYPDHR